MAQEKQKPKFGKTSPFLPQGVEIELIFALRLLIYGSIFRSCTCTS